MCMLFVVFCTWVYAFTETRSIRSPETGVTVVIITIQVLGSDSGFLWEKYLLLTTDPYLQPKHKNCRCLKTTDLMGIFITIKNIYLQFPYYMNKLEDPWSKALESISSPAPPKKGDVGSLLRWVFEYRANSPNINLCQWQEVWFWSFY